MGPLSSRTILLPHRHARIRNLCKISSVVPINVPALGPSSNLISSNIRHTPPPSTSLWSESRKCCSSSRINTLIAVLALGLGTYYYYEQYIIAWRTWEVGVWKDCRDRVVSETATLENSSLIRLQDLLNSSVCLRYSNISYDRIASRSTEILSSAHWKYSSVVKLSSEISADTLSSFVRYTCLLVDCAVMMGYIWGIAGLILHVLAFICDMTSGHNFPLRAYFAGFFFLNTMIASIVTKSEFVRSLTIIISACLVIFNASAVKDGWECCVQASRDRRNKEIWKRQGLLGLMCDPFFLFVIQPVLFVFWEVHGIVYWGTLQNSRDPINTIVISATTALAIFFVILNFSQNAILRALDDTALDPESQARYITAASHRNHFLDKLQSGYRRSGSLMFSRRQTSGMR
jgi:hypothetical protein